jgi:hypothetical protein
MYTKALQAVNPFVFTVKKAAHLEAFSDAPHSRLLPLGELLSNCLLTVYLTQQWCQLTYDTCQRSSNVFTAINDQLLQARYDACQHTSDPHESPYLCHCKGCCCPHLCEVVVISSNSK